MTYEVDSVDELEVDDSAVADRDALEESPVDLTLGGRRVGAVAGADGAEEGDCLLDLARGEVDALVDLGQEPRVE